MTTNDALEFYGPVQQALRNKLEQKIGLKALEMLEKEFDFKFSPEAAAALVKTAGNAFADDQFEQIVEFMSGKRPSQVPLEERDNPGSAKCMVLIFDGVDAVSKIRTLLGPTNPANAPAGTIRYDFGTDLMVNAAHASDSPASYERESAIVKVNENKLSQLARG
jgi:nucleoside diphosphate kinase